MISIVIHSDEEDLFRLPSSETKLENKNHRNINFPGKAFPVGAIKAFGGRRSVAQLTLSLGAR
jgi:hypothetical protein